MAQGLRTLGRSGLKVSPLCLDAMNFGNEHFGGGPVYWPSAVTRNSPERAAAGIRRLAPRLPVVSGKRDRPL